MTLNELYQHQLAVATALRALETLAPTLAILADRSSGKYLAREARCGEAAHEECSEALLGLLDVLGDAISEKEAEGARTRVMFARPGCVAALGEVATEGPYWARR